MRRFTATANTCLVTLVGDYKFYVHSGSSLAAAANTMISHITFADQYLRATNFNGITNIGVGVGKIIVYTTTSNPYYSSGAWDVSVLLNTFSANDWSDTCLAHLFTYQDFSGGIQGLAWVGGTSGVGGICDGWGVHTGSHFNTGLTTLSSFGTNIPTLMALLVTLHEFGHNFGSMHDPDTSSCAPSASAGGRFVMYAMAVDGSGSNNFLFSPCSTARMQPVISAKSTCFQVKPQAICGNGILEVNGTDGIGGTADDEQCDAGYSGDACCTAGCKLRPGAACCDANFICCSNCQAAGTAKRCFTGFALDALCRADTYCLNNSFSCPTPLNQKASGAVCTHGGQCSPSAVEASRCVSVCARFAASVCTCADTANSCQLCCADNSAAAPFCPAGFAWLTYAFPNGTNVTNCRNKTNPSSSVTYPGSRVFPSTCTPAYTVLASATYAAFTTFDNQSFTKSNLVLDPGSVCVGGQCNAGVCQATTSDITSRFTNFFSSLSASAMAAWIKQYLVVAVILFTLVLWVPGSLIVRRKDRKRMAALQNARAQAMQKRRNTFATRAHPAVARNRVAPAPEKTLDSAGSSSV